MSGSSRDYTGMMENELETVWRTKWKGTWTMKWKNMDCKHPGLWPR